jgi:hypothetical protein
VRDSRLPAMRDAVIEKADQRFTHKNLVHPAQIM